MYFSEFPKIYYDAKGQGRPVIVTNLLIRVAIRSKIKDNIMFYDTYDIISGDTPESIAHKLYDDPTLHWVVLLTNDITDRYHQWPMYEQQFNTYVSEKYDNPDGVHHYEKTQSSGKQVGSGPSDYEHKIEVNVAIENFQNIFNSKVNYSKIIIIQKLFFIKMEIF